MKVSRAARDVAVALYGSPLLGSAADIAGTAPVRTVKLFDSEAGFPIRRDHRIVAWPVAYALGLDRYRSPTTGGAPGVEGGPQGSTGQRAAFADHSPRHLQVQTLPVLARWEASRASGSLTILQPLLAVAAACCLFLRTVFLALAVGDHPVHPPPH